MDTYTVCSHTADSVRCVYKTQCGRGYNIIIVCECRTIRFTQLGKRMRLLYNITARVGVHYLQVRVNFSIRPEHTERRVPVYVFTEEKICFVCIQWY